MFENIAFGFCWWDIPALIALIGVIALVVIRKHQLNNEEKKLR